jgi:hypothetical protein
MAAGVAMARPGSWRTAPLPKDWPTTRRRILGRDDRHCTWIETLPDGGHPLAPGAADHPHRCALGANQVDHIGDPDDHSDANLRALCAWHHGHRTALQGNAAHPPGPTLRRESEPHPGLRRIE